MDTAGIEVAKMVNRVCIDTQNDSASRSLFRRLLCLTATGCALVLVVSGCSTPGDVRTESDFATRQERLRFLSEYSPIPVPASAEAIHFRWVDFMEWDMTCSFSASRADISAIMKRVTAKPFKPDQRYIDSDLLSGYAYYDESAQRGGFVPVDLITNRVRFSSRGK